MHTDLLICWHQDFEIHDHEDYKINIIIIFFNKDLRLDQIKVLEITIGVKTGAQRKSVRAGS